ncbi:MAG: hypothetical protein KDB14_25075 [Planctomycetales bacterium]|nr:hypothetical protein [Planctomycetales bacterium]
MMPFLARAIGVAACLCGFSLLGCRVPEPREVATIELYAPLGKRFSDVSQAEAEAALADLESLLATADDPAKVGLLIRQGCYRIALGNEDAAIEDFSAAVALAPDDWRPLFHRWMAYRHIGNLVLASVDEARLLELKPEVLQKTYSREVVGGWI